MQSGRRRRWGGGGEVGEKRGSIRFVDESHVAEGNDQVDVGRCLTRRSEDSCEGSHVKITSFAPHLDTNPPRLSVAEHRAAWRRLRSRIQAHSQSFPTVYCLIEAEVSKTVNTPLLTLISLHPHLDIKL